MSIKKEQSPWVSIEAVALKIATASAEAHPESWDKAGANNDLRRSIGAAVTLHGTESGDWRVPAMLGLFKKLWSDGLIKPRHPDTFLEPSSETDIDLAWLITREEEKVAVNRLKPPGTKSPLADDSKHRWKQPGELEKLKDYREKHGTTKAAKHFAITTARVRQLLPGVQPPAQGYSAFTAHKK